MTRPKAQESTMRNSARTSTSTRPSNTIRRSPVWQQTFVAVGLVAALSACGRSDDDQTVGSRVDGAIAATEQKAAEFKAEASKDVANAGEALGARLSDAAITTSVNAELAKDSSLSALKINVDTSAGRVALKGQAPSAAARERATSLALAVKGVVSVDNQLTLDTTGTM